MTTKVSEPDKAADKADKAAEKTEKSEDKGFDFLAPPVEEKLPEITDHAKSDNWFERAQKVMPGGVNSPVRSCKAVGATPVFMHRADGANIWDIDGNQYLDYCGSWGAMIMGHRFHRVQEALELALINGTSFGAPTPTEAEMAELVCKLMPSIEMVRMVNSGTEATMSAIRLARAFTKRDMIIKFDGCYHGHGDSFLIKAGSGLATLGISSSPGVTEEVAKLSISVAYNDLSAVEKAFKEHKDKIAAIIVEPIAANAGLLMPDENYLSGLREIATKHGALLIFDEVITGFRVALGGAQAKYNVKPDLTCLGKIIGGGLPVGAYGGRKDIMQMVAPLGDVYQAGTLSGNPMAMAAGVAQLRSLEQMKPHAALEQTTQRLATGIQEIAKKAKTQVQVPHTTGLLCVFFTKAEVKDFATAQKADTERFANFWKAMLKHGVYWPPSQFECAFVSAEHSKRDIDNTLAAVEAALS
ncbi:MAG TPA: glutamate-1-semialdehyde 2,1-aminomutase [Candidatus Obscuribacterales bacterium]